MQPLECFASIYFNKKGVKTISLQHGLYIDYYDLETVNVLNYKVQPSTYFLSWGQNTKSLIEKYHSNSKVVICGKPDLKDEATDANISSDKDILIVCDQEIFQKQNFQLIKIVQDFCLENRDWNFKVRFHPHNNKAAYYKTFPNICESTAYSNGQVIVGISSSLLYELGVKGYNVFQFKTNINTIELCVTRQFTSLNSLRELVKSEKKEKSNFTDIIECIGSESEKRYHQFFDAMLGNKGLDFGSEDIPFFTIIIPTYNSSLLIYKAINSLQKQSFKNFEVLIIDGLSTDQTIPITLGLIDRDDRFKIYSQKDCGIYDAMNIGFRKARGKWLYFLGSDDEFYASNILEKVNAHITTNNFDTGMVYGNVEVKGDVKWAKDGTIYDGEFSNLKIKTKNICHQAIFYNRERKKTVGEYNLKYKLCSDWDMNLKVWSKYGGEYLDLTVAYFHAGGVSTAGTDPEFGKDFKLNILEYFGEEG
jgi:hypothetical protein